MRQVLTDNGKVFTGKSASATSRWA